MMRVLLIDVNCKYSSTGKIVYDLYKNLRQQGYKAAIAYGRGKKIDEPYIFKFGLDWETYLHAGLARLTGLNGCYSFFSTKRLIFFIEKYKPDVIHIHELHGYFVNISPLIKYIKRKKIKVIWTFHCEYMYTGKCGHSYECDQWKTECKKCPYLKDYPKSFIFDMTNKMYRKKRDLLKNFDFTIVTPSQWLADRVSESFLKDKPIKVIPNGIDTSVFHPVDVSDIKKKLSIPEDHKVVVSVAPDIMSERKGGQWVIKLAERLKNEKITFLLVGGCLAKNGKSNSDSQNKFHF